LYRRNQIQSAAKIMALTGVMETKSKGFSSRRYGILRRYAALFENATVYRF